MIQDQGGPGLDRGVTSVVADGEVVGGTDDPQWAAFVEDIGAGKYYHFYEHDDPAKAFTAFNSVGGTIAHYNAETGRWEST